MTVAEKRGAFGRDGKRERAISLSAIRMSVGWRGRGRMEVGGEVFRRREIKKGGRKEGGGQFRKVEGGR